LVLVRAAAAVQTTIGIVEAIAELIVESNILYIDIPELLVDAIAL
jgi:hypothetical protein